MLHCTTCHNENTFEVEERTQRLLLVQVRGDSTCHPLCELEDRHSEWTFVRCSLCRTMMEYYDANAAYDAVREEK